MRRSIASLALAAFAALASAAATQETAPDVLVRTSIDEVLAIIKSDKDLQGGNQTRILDLVEEKALPHFDFPRMT
ncbi:MAG TPA: ABC transporter substrate-binding protein, partial [Usitatibacteraceae bacterium]|nr:ABC transporter substrate-binding protein [Usitatibacteraceae bacterium]